MITKEQITQDNSIELHFCNQFESLERYEMDEELFSILYKTLKLEQRLFKIPEDKKPFLFELIEKRIKACFTFKVNSDAFILFLCCLTETPGKAVMYLTFIQYWCKKNNISFVNLKLFCEKIFSQGFPSNSDLCELWKLQKIVDKNYLGSDNLLDHQTALKSIQFA